MSKTLLWEQAYWQSMAFCRAATRHASPQAIEESWHRAFSCVAKSLGVNKKVRKILWDNLAVGNWAHFHPTDEEAKLTACERLEKLHWDVFYCSDRWSLDRLTRCHWAFRQYMHAAREEKVVDA